jgi:hypothetical protein
VKKETLARAILADRNRPQTDTSVMACFACGRSYAPKPPSGDDSTRFCSDNCRQAYDAGFPAYEPLNIDKFYSLPKGPKGFYINCLGCDRRFDSKGLRCCSLECERKYREREQARAVMAEIDMDAPVKRQCEECGGAIPRWRNGRAVSRSARFCSPKCGGKTHRKARSSPDGISTAES